MTTKYDRLREAALEAIDEPGEPYDARGRFADLCTPQTILALLDCVEALRGVATAIDECGAVYDDDDCTRIAHEVPAKLAALDKEQGDG